MTQIEKVTTLRDMVPSEHEEMAYRLMVADPRDAYEQQQINATLAVAHLLLAQWKAN